MAKALASPLPAPGVREAGPRAPAPLLRTCPSVSGQTLPLDSSLP